MHPSDAPPGRSRPPKPLTPAQRAAAPFVLAGFLLLGLGLVVWGGVMIAGASATSAWPTVDGEVLGSGARAQIRGRTGEKETVYTPSIHYRYRVAETMHQSHRIYYAGERTYASRFRAENAVESILNGSRSVRVFYNPTDPAEAVLVPGLSLGPFLLVAFGLLLAAFPIGAVWYDKKRQRLRVASD